MEAKKGSFVGTVKVRNCRNIIIYSRQCITIDRRAWKAIPTDGIYKIQ